MQEILLFTKTNLIEWLDHSNPPKGLSEKVIAPQRAWAIAHNPYIFDDDPVVSALFEDEELAAYTAAFPELIEGKRMWWFSTLFCYPQFEGKGYGLIVIGSLAEIYGEENVLDRRGAKETIKIFEYLGCRTVFSRRYIFRDKQINHSPLKGKILFVHQETTKWLQRKSHKVESLGYSLNYLSHIDDATYSFMQSHKCNDLFLHTKEMINWEIAYPFKQTSPLLDRVPVDNLFSSTVFNVQHLVVQVWKNGILIGCYVLKIGKESLIALYIYYKKTEGECVFHSILEHLIKLNIQSFQTEDIQLANYVKDNYYFPKKEIEMISFSFPNNIAIDTTATFQLGDGDGFA